MWIASHAAAGSLSDPAGASVIVSAVSWIEGTLLGTLATSIAVMAVSWVGMLMLAGRLEIRRGLTTIAGCFILFGASAIAGGIRAVAGGDGPVIAYMPPPVAPPVQPSVPTRNADPYAGAALPGR